MIALIKSSLLKRVGEIYKKKDSSQGYLVNEVFRLNFAVRDKVFYGINPHISFESLKELIHFKFK
jgi:hypothetical protein